MLLRPTTACLSGIVAAQAHPAGLSEAELVTRMTEDSLGDPHFPRPLPKAHRDKCAAAEPCCTSLATVAVVLAAFPGNAARAVLAPSSLPNLAFETIAHSLSAVPSSLGMDPKCVHAHLLGWAGLSWQDL